MAVLYFVLLLGGLIFVHELGHFFVARASGVRILTFSIGFGPAIFSRRKGETEYRIGVVPLGGYVRMFGDEPDAVVPESERYAAFNYKPLWKRTLIVMAGPTANLLLPFAVFFSMFLGHSNLLPPYIGAVKEGGPAWKASIRAGDTVAAVNGEEIRYWWELEQKINDSIGMPLALEVRRGDDMFSTTVVPEEHKEVKFRHMDLVDREGRIQVIPLFVEPVISVRDGLPAHAAGLRNWDRVLFVDGTRARTFSEVLAALESPTEHTLLLARETPIGSVGHARLAVYAPLTVRLRGGPAEILGLDSAQLVVHQVDPGTPADTLGLKPGDRILSVDDEKFPLWFLFEGYLAERVEEEHTLAWWDGDSERTATFSLTPSTEKGEFNEERRVVIFGAHNHSAVGTPEPIPNQDRLHYALTFTAKAAADAFEITIASIAGLFVGKVPLKELGGPILIYDMASRTGQHGWEWFLNLLAWLSISLGIINLLPIPILDGGHLLFFAIEGAMRRPIPVRIRQYASYVGLVLLLLLMIVVFHNDIARNWDSISNWF